MVTTAKPTHYLVSYSVVFVELNAQQQQQKSTQ